MRTFYNLFKVSFKHKKKNENSPSLSVLLYAMEVTLEQNKKYTTWNYIAKMFPLRFILTS
jgi:hypothetical protein